jgi:hypothetical protein
MPNLPLATQNLARVAQNRLAKLHRQSQKYSGRTSKLVRDTLKDGRVGLRRATRAATTGAYVGAVRFTRYWKKVNERTWPRLTTDVSVRLDLWSAARGSAPIVVGPWLSEVGYEVLYWIPFLRWFVDYYRIDPARVIAVSRGGVSGWYDGIANRYVELLDLYPPGEFAARNRARQQGDQKQKGIAALDDEIIAKVRERIGGGDLHVCHPSMMFRLLRQFWLGNESLDHALSYLHYQTMAPQLEMPSAPALSALPDEYVAMKFYTARSFGAHDRHNDLLRGVVESIARRHPVVLLGTGLALDEHEDFLFAGIPGVTNAAAWMRPENNLGVQTEIIRRARRFVGTCGSVAWLAPMLGTDTLAVYSDDHLLTSHLYAARHGYASMTAGRFVALDLSALELMALDDTLL